MNEHFPPSDTSGESGRQYSGPYEHDPRDPVRIGEMLEAISEQIEEAAKENLPVADARNRLRELLDPLTRQGREVTDEELGTALYDLGRALRGDEGE